MALDELLQGLQVFQQGMQQLAIGNATRDANQRLTEINTTISNDNEKRIATSQLGQELALRMSGIGAAPGQIEALAQRLSPSPGQLEQQRFAQEQTKGNQAFESGQNALNRQATRENAVLGLYAANAQTSAGKALEQAKGNLGEIRLQPGAIYNETRANRVVEDMPNLKQAMRTVGNIQDMIESGVDFTGAKKAQLATNVTGLKRILAGKGVFAQQMGAAISPQEQVMLDTLARDPTDVGNRMKADSTLQASYQELFKKIETSMHDTLASNQYEVTPGGALDKMVTKGGISAELRKASADLNLHDNADVAIMLRALSEDKITPVQRDQIKSRLQRLGMSAELLRKY